MIDMKTKTATVTSMIGAGLAAAILGLAAPASADIGHNQWVNGMSAMARAPHVDTTTHH